MYRNLEGHQFSTIHMDIFTNSSTIWEQHVFRQIAGTPFLVIESFYNFILYWLFSWKMQKLQVMPFQFPLLSLQSFTKTVFIFKTKRRCAENIFNKARHP